ncbi:MAG: phosphate--acyl-ACP acyltransferase, partial [Oscillospiraceae bacterium]|nr:phosphate--acyl-ACP acyltransferase [Oscillospiraceae bacterium]
MNMKVLVDAFGGDNAPLEIIKGCRLCLDKYEGLTVGLVGNQEIIEKTAKEHSISLEGMVLHHAPDIISMDEDAGEIMKSKNESS